MNQFQSFDEVLSALRRRAGAMMAIFFLGCVAAVFFALKQEKLYSATAVIQIEEPVIPEQLAGASAPRDDSGHRLRLIEQRLMAVRNIERIIDEYGIFADAPDLARDQQIFQMRTSIQLEEIIDQAQAWQPDVAPTGLYISVTLADPELAAEVANSLMRDVIDLSRERGQSAARETLAFFVSEEARVSKAIVALEERIAAFKQANSDALPDGAASARSQIVTLREAELAIDREIVALEGSSARLREEERNRQLALLSEQKVLLQSRISALEAALERAPEVERELSALERELTQYQEQFAVISRRKAEAELGQVLQDRQQTERFEVLEEARVPENPVTRSRKQIAIMGVAGSLVMAVIAGFLLELLNPALRSASQMERELGIRPVVAIPVVQGRRETNRRRFKWVLIGLTILAALYALARNLGERLLSALWVGFTGAAQGRGLGG